MLILRNLVNPVKPTPQKIVFTGFTGFTELTGLETIKARRFSELLDDGALAGAFRTNLANYLHVNFHLITQ